MYVSLRSVSASHSRRSVAAAVTAVPDSNGSGVRARAASVPVADLSTTVGDAGRRSGSTGSGADPAAGVFVISVSIFGGRTTTLAQLRCCAATHAARPSSAALGGDVVRPVARRRRQRRGRAEDDPASRRGAAAARRAAPPPVARSRRRIARARRPTRREAHPERRRCGCSTSPRAARRAPECRRRSVESRGVVASARCSERRSAASPASSCTVVRGVGRRRVDAVHVVAAAAEGERQRRAEPSAGADDDDGLADRSRRRWPGASAIDVERARGVAREAFDRRAHAVERARRSTIAARALVDVARRDDACPALVGVVSDEPEREAAEQGVQPGNLHPDDVAAPRERPRAARFKRLRTESAGELVELGAARYEIADVLRSSAGGLRAR